MEWNPLKPRVWDSNTAYRSRTEVIYWKSFSVKDFPKIIIIAHDMKVCVKTFLRSDALL